jgi:hypothetical protein
MKVSDDPNALSQFRKTPWAFQQTFKTPLKRLEPFVATIASSSQPLRLASVTIEQVVFEPKGWIGLLTRYSLPVRYEKGVSVIAEGRLEIEELLRAALSDWVDFLFVPTPEPFVIYADHDEYTTFYAQDRSNLSQVTEALLAQGFEQIAGYERAL